MMKVIKMHMAKVISTQDFAKTQKLVDNSYLLCTADEQTKGRGTHGRSWYSPPQENIYATLSFKIPKNQIKLLPNIPQVISCSIAHGLMELGVVPQIKWVNDILINKKKVVGILCEADDKINHCTVYAGFGVNVNMPKKELLLLNQPATSVALELNKKITKEQVLEKIEKHLYHDIDYLLSDGFIPFYERISKLLAFKNEEIFFDTEAKTKNAIIQGKLLGIDKNGYLLIDTNNGIQSFFNGRILVAKQLDKCISNSQCFSSTGEFVSMFTQDKKPQLMKSMGMNQILQHSLFGEPLKVLKLVNQPIPYPKEAEVIIKMTASCINPSDLLKIRGIGPYKERTQLPSIPGFEGAGTIVTCGQDVDQKWLGKKVLVSKGEGTWQEYIRMPLKELVFLPDKLPDEYAAQLYINPLTAWLIITEKLQLREREKENVIVIGNAANSTMGRLFCQLSKHFGFTFIAVVRKDNYAQELLELGAKYVINSQKDNLINKILNYTNSKLPTIALEAVGGEDGINLVDCLADKGRCLIYGNLSLQAYPRLSKNKVLMENFFLRDWVYNHSTEERKKIMGEMINFFIKHDIKLPVANKFPLKDFHQAISLYENSKNNDRQGKVVFLGQNNFQP